MDKLNRYRLTKDNTDFKYKKYILLDYLQRVNNQFKENKLYPYLSDCIEEFRSLKDLLEQKDKLTPKELTSIDVKNMELVYTTIDDDIFRAGGEPAVADNLPGYYPQEVQCSESQATAAECQIPVLPINTVLIPDSIQPQLQALYSVGETTVAKENKKSMVIPQWLKKSAGSNNFS